MKRFIALMIVMILLVSMLGVMTASAGLNSVKISGATKVQAGKTYEYTITVSATGLNFISIVTSGGVFSSVTTDCDASRSSPGSLKKSVKIKVKVNSNAQPGQKGTISVRGEGGSIDSNYNTTDEYTINKTLTAEVVTVAPSTPKPATNSEPKATKAPGEWDIAEQQVALLGSEGTLSVDIKEDKKVPGIVLTTLKEKQAKLTLNFGTYSCTIDGKTLAALDDIKDIDLTMKMEKDENFSKAVGGKDAYQLHFSHEGQLPGKFTYSFLAQGNAPGDTLYLYYYYDKSGVAEGTQSATVDENGYVTFDIYHCSSYFFSAAPVEGATGVNFLAEGEAAEAQKQAQQAYSELEAQLKEAQSALTQAQAQLDAANADQTPDVQEANPETKDNRMYAASAADPLEKLLGIPYASFIAAALGVALLSSLLTMLVLRVGVFKKKEVRKDGII